MIIIKLNRKISRILVITIITGSLIFNIYSCIQNQSLTDKYKRLSCFAKSLNQADIITFLTSSDTDSQANKYVEIFDINIGNVVKRVKSNQVIQSKAESYLREITGMYTKVKAIPDNGYIIRIPLKPAVNVKNQWLNSRVEELFVIFTEQVKPYLLVLDDEKRPVFYTFDGSTEDLLRELEYKGFKGRHM
jgi:hypothetical protein